ncbi:MAG TPA: class I SAM-dependent methyltransferase [Candidatus Acidoferrum sp.]|nr:class I SAM-dependent methyltransferase [Candidatus Acidoferrum sp.]
MDRIQVPSDLNAVLDAAWSEARKITGYVAENEARFLGMLAACLPAEGRIVEIGSFKGRSTVMLGKIAAHYGVGPVVAIDPHNSPILLGTDAHPESSSHQDFLNSLREAGISDSVDARAAYSTEVAKTWNQPIRLLWIDGDHSYQGAKNDLEGFAPYLQAGGVVAIHDALNVFPGPIRVFIEEILRSDRFGPAGFVHSIAWAQYRPEDGVKFRTARQKLDRHASKLLPFVNSDGELRGLRKKIYKLRRYLVPHSAIRPEDLPGLINSR